MEALNQSDFDATLDIHEKLKRTKMHQEILNRIESRPDEVKVKKFLQYEKCNMKTHLYMKANKLDTLFKELNASKGRPQVDFHGNIVVDASLQENSL
jgi:hypothetical protein